MTTFQIVLLIYGIFGICYTNTVFGQEKILGQLAAKFKDFPDGNQYAVFYLPPPNAPNGKVFYVPMAPGKQFTSRIVYPNITDDMINRGEYPFTYSAMTPDFNGARFKKILNRGTKNITIHTEDLAVNLLYPRMEKWYYERYNKKPNKVYLYSWYLPCPSCTNIIGQFLSTNSDKAVFVGYTELYGGAREGQNETRKAETRKRRAKLESLLKNHSHGSNLYTVSKQCFIARRKRDLGLSENCFDDTTGSAQGNFKVNSACLLALLVVLINV